MSRLPSAADNGGELRKIVESGGAQSTLHCSRSGEGLQGKMGEREGS
jgi:hypothetical protein